MSELLEQKFELDLTGTTTGLDRPGNEITSFFLSHSINFMEALTFDANVHKFLCTKLDQELPTPFAISDFIKWANGKKLSDICRTLDSIYGTLTPYMYAVAAEFIDEQEKKKKEIERMFQNNTTNQNGEYMQIDVYTPDSIIDAKLGYQLMKVENLTSKMGENYLRVCLGLPCLKNMVNSPQAHSYDQKGDQLITAIIQHNESKKTPVVRVRDLYFVLHQLSSAGQSIRSMQAFIPELKKIRL